MSPEERELLKRSISLSEDNNKILHSMRRSMRWGNAMSALYWVLIIGSAIGAFYFIQPYIDEIVKTYGSIGAALKNFPK
jgi:TRAP-type C4-dicarboxylate transport system permease small subunit